MIAIAGIHERGYWVGANADLDWIDKRVADALCHLLRGATVADFGCGSGYYVRRLWDAGVQAQGFDGNPETPTLAPGCRVLDLSEPQDLGPPWQWVLSLEVGEHIPAEFATAFLDNVAQHASAGVVLSWAVPGQPGCGHVNCRSNAWVVAEMARRDFRADWPETQRLRAAAVLPWFRETLLVLRRIV